jgi:hypothetical protein
LSSIPSACMAGNALQSGRPARSGGALRVGTTRAPGKLPAGRAERHARSSRRAERQFGMEDRSMVTFGFWRVICGTEKSGGGPPQSKTLARGTEILGKREASWSAPVLWRLGIARRTGVGPIGLRGGFLAERGLSQTAARGPAETRDNLCAARFGEALRVGTTRAPVRLRHNPERHALYFQTETGIRFP